MRGFGEPQPMNYTTTTKLPPKLSIMEHLADLNHQPLSQRTKNANADATLAEVRQEILAAVCNMSNHVNSEEAQETLRKYAFFTH